jgi:serine/threonine protein kinase
MPSPQNREEALFRAAVELPPGAARLAFLEQACAGDPALRHRLEALLAAHDEPDELSPRAAPALVATLKLDLPDTEDEAVGQTLGRYKLLEKVGEGGCGVVYVAEQTEPVRRRVALKVIKLGMDTKQVVARFEAERQALAMMDHPNIAKVLDAGTTEQGRPFFVMELVRGIKITDYCDQAALTTKERLDLFIKVCQAIQHAHQKGIIHRDIKPSSILVTLHDGVPVPKVIDFGIAKATEGRLTDNTVYTQLHQFIGTPAYMSPEQAEMSGLDIDTRSDIYSLGVLLYELLAGRTPFDAKELMSLGIDAMRKTIREKEPERPSTKLATLQGEELTTMAKRRSTDTSKLLHQLKGDLDWIVMKCLEKDRTRRYDTANGLAFDLKRHLNNEPVVARPPSTAYRFQKAFRRNKLVFTAATAVTAALVLGIIASTWQWARATHATRDALAAQANESKQRQLAEQEARRAEEARKIADRETILARRTAAQADARYLLQARLLPAALTKAAEAFKLGGEWEDGLLIHDIAAAARQTWVLSARVPMSEAVTLACVAKTQSGSCLVLSLAGGLRVIDARTGVVLGSAPLEQGVRYLFQGSDSNTVLAISDSAVSVLSLPSLTVRAKKALQNPPTYAASKGSSLLLVLPSHEVCLLDLHTLSEIGAFNWDTNPAAKDLSFPRHACLSPDGKLVLLHGGSWNMPVLFWDRRNDPPTFFTNQITLQQFQFIDNAHLATWYTPSPNVDGGIGLYDVEHAPVRTSWQSVPGDDTKGNLQFQAWSSKEWGYHSAFPILGLVGPSGLVLKGLSGGEFTGGSTDFTLSDRYANLLPIEADAPEFLAADLARGVLALRCRNDLLLFHLGGSYWNGRIQDYCATACRDGLLCVNHEFTPTSMRLFFIPFDPRQATARFSLQWLADSRWLPWAIGATPDASTVVVIAQETDSDSTITARYGRTRALIYHPGGLRTAASAWPIQTAFEVDAPTDNAWSSRFVALDPDARALLYWNSGTTVMRYDPRDGKPLGALELGPVCAHSRDGRRVAAVSPTGRLCVYDMSSGDTLFDLAGKAASGLCLSADGSRLVVSQTNRLSTYDIGSGRELSSVESRLLPLAYPSRGNRFLAFQPDTSGTGGSIVLADTTDAHVAAVLNRAGNTFTPAFFSDSGDQLALVRDRWEAEVVRSLHPDELSAVLTASLPETAKLQSLPPTNIVTTAHVSLAVLRSGDIPVLVSHLGDKVTVEGRVRDVWLVPTRNAANTNFVGADTSRVMVWVPWATYPKLIAVLGQNLGAALNDHTIRATGRLSKYKESLEVTLDDPSQLQIVAPAVQSN